VARCPRLETLDEHRCQLLDIAARRGVPAAVDAIRYAIANGSGRPIEDTRPSSNRAAPAQASNNAVARAVAAAPEAPAVPFDKSSAMPPVEKKRDFGGSRRVLGADGHPGASGPVATPPDSGA